MKWIKTLGVFALLAVITSIIPICQATIEKEYTYKVKHLLRNDVVYAYRLKLVIETEENGVWIIGKYYTITFILTVDFINFTYLDALNFSNFGIYTIHDWYVNFSKDYPAIESIVFGKGGLTLSYPQFVVEFKAYPKCEGRIGIFPRMSVETINPKFFIGGGNWRAQEPLYIDITTDQVATQIDEITTRIDEIRNLIYILISIIIILIAVTCYFNIKKFKSKSVGV